MFVSGDTRTFHKNILTFCNCHRSWAMLLNTAPTFHNGTAINQRFPRTWPDNRVDVQSCTKLKIVFCFPECSRVSAGESRTAQELQVRVRVCVFYCTCIILSSKYIYKDGLAMLLNTPTYANLKSVEKFVKGVLKNENQPCQSMMVPLKHLLRFQLWRS